MVTFKAYPNMVPDAFYKRLVLEVAWDEEQQKYVGTDDNVTREQMATILYRYAQNCGYDTTARADLNGYTDAAKISSYAQEAMSWANAMGLINGRTAASLAPTGTATRAEVAAIFHRFVENIVR